MGKSAPTPPTPPDPNVVSAAQTKSNQQTALYQSQLNNTNVNGPYGQVNYTYNPQANQWTQNTQLSPAEQSIFQQGTQAQGHALGIANDQLGNVAHALNTPLAPTGPLATGVNAGPIQQSIGPQNFGDAVNNTVQANYQQQMGLLAPQMQQAAEQEQAQLTAQGLNPNDAAYQNAMQLFNNSQAMQRAQVADNAVNAGNAEQNLLFGQSAAQGQFANAAQAQGFGQGLQNANLYNAANQQVFNNTAYGQELPINEFTALLGAGQVQAPQSTPAQTSVSPTDVLGAYALNSQAAQNTYDAQMQQYSSGLGGLFNLGSAAIGLGSKFLFPSDRRVKRDIRKLPATLAGFPLYAFRYLWSDKPCVGVMADEVIERRPDAVRMHPDGYMLVDYGALA